MIVKLKTLDEIKKEYTIDESLVSWEKDYIYDWYVFRDDKSKEWHINHKMFPFFDGKTSVKVETVDYNHKYDYCFYSTKDNRKWFIPKEFIKPKICIMFDKILEDL